MGAEEPVIQLVTRCASAEEFIERFARYTTANDVVVPALANLTVGTAGPFVICLKDKSVMLKGRCEVAEIRPVVLAPGAAPSGLALMRLHLREMDAHSAGIHLRLMERHASWAGPPAKPAAAAAPRMPALPAPSGSTADGAVPASEVTSDTSAVTVAGPETTAISPLPRREERAPGATFTLPANPLGDLDAADLASFIDHTLFETDAAMESAAPGGAVDVDSNGAVDAAPTVSTARVVENRADRARRIARRAAPFGACLLGGLLVGIAFRPASKPAPAVSVVSPPSVVAPAPAPAPAPARAVDGTPDGDPIPSARSCFARVTTKPAGAKVLWGDVELGSSPIAHAPVPCGTVTVTLRRDHYTEVTREITADHERNAVVAERLRRPPAKLMVTSSPPRAVIKINKHRMGPTPREVAATRFERIRIEASLPGYRPWRKTMVLTDEEAQVDVRLVRKRGSIAGGASAAPTPAARPATTPPAGTAVAVR